MHQESDPNSTKVSAKHLINYHVQWIKCQVLYVEEYFRCSLVRTIGLCLTIGLCFSMEKVLPANKKKYSNIDKKLNRQECRTVEIGMMFWLNVQTAKPLVLLNSPFFK